jgi:hypothetical protein
MEVKMKKMNLFLIAVFLFITANAQQVVSLTAGWHGISTYLELTEPCLDSIFKDLPVTIIKSDYGTVYWPDQGINTIGDWITSEGYQIHIYADCDIIFYGIQTDELQLILSPGWHYIPVLVDYPINVENLFGTMTGGQGDIILETAGMGVYWPWQNINSLKYLIPGHAYKLHCDSWLLVNYDIRIGIEPLKIKGKSINFLFDILGRRIK